jgi:predicted amidohydrolase YtcJ
MDLPKRYLADCVSQERPVLIMDQSGHLAYVNQKAFEVTCLALTGKKECTPPSSVTNDGGEWVTANGEYTGLLRESSAYRPFFQALTKGLLLESLRRTR